MMMRCDDEMTMKVLAYFFLLNKPVLAHGKGKKVRRDVKKN